MLMDIIKERHAIRKYTEEPLHRKPRKSGRIVIIE